MLCLCIWAKLVARSRASRADMRSEEVGDGSTGYMSTMTLDNVLCRPVWVLLFRRKHAM